MLEHRIVYEEVPGSRTTQETIINPQRERIAYEELQPGDRIQPGDEWKNGDGRWQPYVCLTGLLQFVQDGHAARRPHRVNTIIIDALADAHAATAQLQNERDEARAAIAKDTGIIRFSDGAITIVADLPKKVDWDQAKLAALVETIRGSGEDPGQYIEISFSVSERAYGAWPDAIRRAFEPARTLRTGKPTFRLLRD